MAERRASSDSNSVTPLWVKVQGVLVILLIIVVLGMFIGVLNIGLLTGGSHGMPVGGH